MFNELDNMLESVKLEAHYDELYVVTEPDKYYNVNKFGKSSNIMLITGLSGSGKTTLAREKLKENNAILLELDYLYFRLERIEADKFIKWDDVDQAGYDIIEEYVKIAKNDHLDDFMKWFMSNYKNDKRNFILEGIQLYWLRYPASLRKMPVIIMMTSSLKSAWRTHTREMSGDDRVTIKDKVHSLTRFIDPKFIKWYIKETKRLKGFIEFMEG